MKPFKVGDLVIINKILEKPLRIGKISSDKMGDYKIEYRHFLYDTQGRMICCPTLKYMQENAVLQNRKYNHPYTTIFT